MGTDKKEIGAKISQLRRKQNLRQSDLALMARMTPAQISVIEGGKRAPRVATLARIAKALGVEVEVFFRSKLPERGAVSANDMIRVGSYLVKQGRHQRRASA